MLTELQTVILTCLLGPEDTGAFQRECWRLKGAQRRKENPEPMRAANRKSGRKRRRLLKPEGVRPWGVTDPVILNARRDARIAYAKQYRLDNPEKDAEYRENNPESVKASARKQYLKDPEKRCLESKRYREENPEKVRANEKKKRERNKRDPKARLVRALRTRLRDSIRSQGVKKSDRTMELIGCSVEHVKAHIESLFKPGMTWENYGFETWHIDHIKPIAKFDLTNPEEQRACFHWTNLQPLFALDNLKKGDKYAG